MPPLPPGYRIRRARTEELEELPGIERLSAGRFALYGFEGAVLDDVTDLAEIRRAHEAGFVWVAVEPCGSLVGLAFAAPVDDALHLEEIDVLPDHGRRGIGTALVEAVVEAAWKQGFAAVTLTTYRGIPWNAPFHARQGFRVREDPELGPGLREAVASEERRGLHREERVVMRRDGKEAP